MKNYSSNIFMDNDAVGKHCETLDPALKGLECSGKNLQSLMPNNLVPIDEFHTGGRKSTIEIPKTETEEIKPLPKKELWILLDNCSNKKKPCLWY